MWGLPRPGIEPVSHALQSGFLTTGPPGKPLQFLKWVNRQHLKVERLYKNVLSLVLNSKDMVTLGIQTGNCFSWIATVPCRQGLCSLVPSFLDSLLSPRHWGPVPHTSNHHVWAALLTSLPFFFFFPALWGMQDDPQAGIELCPQQWKGGVLTIGPPGKSHLSPLKKKNLAVLVLSWSTQDLSLRHTG